MTTPRSLLTLIPLLTAVLLFADGAGELVISQQPKSAPSRQPTPEEVKEVDAAVRGMTALSEKFKGKNAQQLQHDLIDHILASEGIPEPEKSTFLKPLLDQRKQIHQLYDRETTRLRLEIEKQTPPSLPQKRSSLDYEQWKQSLAIATAQLSDSWDPLLVVRRIGLGSPRNGEPPQPVPSRPHGAEFYRVSTESGSVSVTEGNVTGKAEGTVWSDDADHIGIDTTPDIKLDLSAVEKDTSAHLGMKMKDRAIVDRCPAVDGLVKGSSELMFAGQIDGRAAGKGVGDKEAVVEGRFSYNVKTTAESHVGDDARLKNEVKIQAEIMYEKRSFGRTAKASVSEFQNMRIGGEAEFDLRDSEERVTLRVTRCVVGSAGPELCLAILEYQNLTKDFTVNSRYPRPSGRGTLRIQAALVRCPARPDIGHSGG